MLNNFLILNKTLEKIWVRFLIFAFIIIGVLGFIL